jgi:hypothetical protein
MTEVRELCGAVFADEVEQNQYREAACPEPVEGLHTVAQGRIERGEGRTLGRPTTKQGYAEGVTDACLTLSA